MNKKSILNGAALLTVTGLLCKLLGAIYRIPLQNILLADGMAYFQAAYPIYVLMAIMCTVGMPGAISRLVSLRRAKGDKRGAQEVFLYSTATLSLAGAAVSLIIWLCGDSIAVSIGMPLAAQAIKIMAPLVFLCMSLSAFRGYYQGLFMMWPTAISQLIEIVVKIALGLILATSWISKGPEHAAVGAVIAIVVGELAAVACMLVMYALGVDQTHARFGVRTQDVAPVAPSRTIAQVWQGGIAATLGAAVIPLTMLIDAIFSVPRLVAAGFEYNIARDAFGIYMGVALPMAILPSALITVVTFLGVPALAAQLALKQHSKVRKSASISLKITFITTIPFAVGLYLMSDQILTLLFSSSMQPSELALCAQMVRLLCFGVPFFALTQASAAILQGVGRSSIPAITAIFCIAMKVAVNLVLTPMQGVNILGPAFATIVIVAAAALINTAYAVQVTGMRFNFVAKIVKPLLGSAVMGIAIFVLDRFVLVKIVGATASTIACIVLGAVIYGVMCILLRIVDHEEANMLPAFDALSPNTGV